jgi:AraC-like DNA-binding protein
MPSSSKTTELSRETDPAWTRGILNPAAEGQRFQLARLLPSAEAASVVERYWSVRWDLAPEDSYLSETMPYPSVNVVFEPGASHVNGICTRRWSRTLQGRGRVFAAKFWPGAFAAFFARPIAELTDRTLPLREVFGAAGDAVAEQLLAQEEDAERARVFEAFLLPRLPAVDPERVRLTQIVSLALATKTLRRAAELAEAAQLSARSLQRLFRRYLGVTPKWLLCRARIQEAAERVAAGGAVDWASLASELGYFDQAHFASDFKAQIGKTPSAYAALTQARTR